MDITCEGCNSRFRIPDGKIPPGKTVSVNCPKCSARFRVQAPEVGQGVSAASFEEEEARAAASEPAPAVDKKATSPMAFDFQEEEGKIALICETGPEARERLKETLTLMDYHCTTMETPHEALRYLRKRHCELVVVEEHFGRKDQNPVTLYLSRLSMASRRETYVVLLTEEYRTLDETAAFVESVDMVVHRDHIADFERLVRHGLVEHAEFYEIFKAVMREEGHF